MDRQTLHTRLIESSILSFGTMELQFSILKRREALVGAVPITLDFPAYTYCWNCGVALGSPVSCTKDVCLKELSRGVTALELRRKGYEPLVGWLSTQVEDLGFHSTVISPSITHSSIPTYWVKDAEYRVMYMWWALTKDKATRVKKRLKRLAFNPTRRDLFITEILMTGSFECLLKIPLRKLH